MEPLQEFVMVVLRRIGCRLKMNFQLPVNFYPRYTISCALLRWSKTKKWDPDEAKIIEDYGNPKM